MKHTKRRTFATSGLGLGLILLAACNGAERPASPTDVLNYGAQTVVLRHAFDDVEPGGVRVFTFNLPQPGVADVTVSWGDARNSVVTLFGISECIPVNRNRDECRIRGPREERVPAGHLRYHGRAGDYEVRLQNEGPGAESINVMVQLEVDPPVYDPYLAPAPGAAN
jgi:hypothetical protein